MITEIRKSRERKAGYPVDRSRRRAVANARLAIVQVASHSRHRQQVSTVMTFASVSMIFPLHCGHWVGRATVVVDGVTGIVNPLFQKLLTRSQSRLLFSRFAKAGVCRARASAWAKLRPARWQGGRLRRWRDGTSEPARTRRSRPFPRHRFCRPRQAK